MPKLTQSNPHRPESCCLHQCRTGERNRVAVEEPDNTVPQNTNQSKKTKQKTHVKILKEKKETKIANKLAN